jgi:hypothetical protein
VHNLKGAIAGNVEASGLQADCPLREGIEMSAEQAAAVEDEVGVQAKYICFAFVLCCVCCRGEAVTGFQGCRQTAPCGRRLRGAQSRQQQ